MSWQKGFEHIVRENEPLAPYCRLGLGGDAEFFAEPTSIDELVGVVAACRENDIPTRVLGGGTNLLVRDEGLAGLTIKLTAPEFSQINIDGNRITAGTGATLSQVVASAAREGLSGLESLVGIPGTIGGAIHGNTGSKTSDVGAKVQAVDLLTRSGEQLTRTREEMTFAYRKSSLDELALLSAVLELESSDREEVTRRMQTQWIVKSAAQPKSDHRTACLFVDPQGMTAAELIDQANQRGARIGGASLFERDTNYVIVDESAKASDVLGLIDLLKSQVTQQVGVDLETALQIW